MDYGASLQFVDTDIRGPNAGLVGDPVVCVHLCVVLHRVTGVSCALGTDSIGILCFALTGVIFGPDRIGILCSA